MHLHQEIGHLDQRVHVGQFPFQLLGGGRHIAGQGSDDELSSLKPDAFELAVAGAIGEPLEVEVERLTRLAEIRDGITLNEGQVRKIGDQVRINLTLTETDGGSVVWSDKVARPFAELLDLLDTTAAKIAATVFGRMEDASMITARRKQPENMSAFECLLAWD